MAGDEFAQIGSGVMAASAVGRALGRPAIGMVGKRRAPPGLAGDLVGVARPRGDAGRAPGCGCARPAPHRMRGLVSARRSRSKASSRWAVSIRSSPMKLSSIGIEAEIDGQVGELCLEGRRNRDRPRPRRAAPGRKGACPPCPRDPRRAAVEADGERRSADCCDPRSARPDAARADHAFDGSRWRAPAAERRPSAARHQPPAAGGSRDASLSHWMAPAGIRWEQRAGTPRRLPRPRLGSSRPVTTVLLCCSTSLRRRRPRRR